MRSVKNTLSLLLLSATSVIVLSSCAGGPVVEVEPCVEIPFVDGAEGACTNTVKHTPYLVPADKWAKMRPTMIMLRASDWSKIRVKWLQACMGNDECNVYVYSVDRAVKALDSMAGQMLKPQP